MTQPPGFLKPLYARARSLSNHRKEPRTSVLGNTEKPFCIKRKNIRLGLFADFRRLDFIDGGAMFVARRLRIKQAAEEEPLRTPGFDELPDISRAAHVGSVEQNVRRPLGDVQR